MASLLLIDTSVPMYQSIAAAAKPVTAVVLFDSNKSSLEDIVGQVNALPTKSFSSVGLVQDGTHRMPSYQIVRSQSPCALRNLETVGLTSWAPVIGFLQSLQSLTGMSVFDFISCDLGANPGFAYAITQISSQLALTLRASKDRTGNLAEGGNWIQESAGVNIQDVYFTDAIAQYTGVLLSTTHKNTSAMVTANNPTYAMVSPVVPVLGMVKTTTPSEIFSWPTGAPSGTGYTAIASSVGAFAALGPNGTITPWGSSSYGGTGAPSGQGYTAIASSFTGFAALGPNGTITPWGSNYYGGSGAPSGEGYTAIASSYDAFAALGPNGTVVSWGNSSYGGTGAPSGEGYTAIASNYSAFAALGPNGTVVSWGSDYYGGSGAPSGQGYTAISSNYGAFAALGPNGTITTWGNDSNGGTGAPSGQGYTAIASSYDAFAALGPNGTITTWGSSSYGGTGVPSGEGYTAIASSSQAFAALGPNGTIVSWGESGSGGTGAPSGEGYTSIASSYGAFAAFKSTPPLIPCFLAGTPVLTPNGYRPIETIAKGDLVITSDFRTVPVKKTYNKEIQSAGPSAAPYFIPAGSLGPEMPCSDLVMSPAHCVQVSAAEDLWLPAWRCAKLSPAVKQIHLGETIMYYNLVLPNYFTDNLVVFDGVVVESMNSRILEFVKEKGAFLRISSA